MTTSLTALPTHRTPVLSEGIITYTWIPQLHELLPQTAGLAGIEYLQCAAENHPKADAQGWKQIHKSRPYVIASPDDPTKRISMVLLGFGKPIPGVSPYSGKRQCYVDELVEVRTGLTVTQTAPAEAAAEAKTSPETPVAKPQGSAQVFPSERKASGSGGAEARSTKGA